jgi:hypothetical protein
MRAWFDPDAEKAKPANAEAANHQLRVIAAEANVMSGLSVRAWLKNTCAMQAYVVTGAV